VGTKTPNLALYKPTVGEYGWGAAVNENFDILDEQIASRAMSIPEGVEGNYVSIDSEGNLVDSGTGPHETMHPRKHDLDSPSDHGGIAGEENKLMAINENGLPKNSGIRRADVMQKPVYDVAGDGKVDAAAGGTGIDTSASTGLPHVGDGDWEVILTNLDAEAAPTVNDDTTKGYAVGSRWMYDEKEYVCLDATEGAAVWKETTAATDDWITTGAITALEFLIDGCGEAIVAGQKGHLYVPYNCRVTAVVMLADQVGSIVVDIWNDTHVASPPTDADSITGDDPPTIDAAQKSYNNTLHDWDVTLAAHTWLAYNVDSCTDIERVTVALVVTRI